MKHVNSKSLAIALALSALLSGCTKHETKLVERENSGNSYSGMEMVQVEGTSSGGGGFVTANSKTLLEKMRDELANTLRVASPEIFADLPGGWNQNKLADVISGIRMEPNRTNRRENTDLMFDYGTEAGRPYISALKPFFANYASVPVNYLQHKQMEPMRRDLYHKMLHEVMHHLGYGTQPGTDAEAATIATRIVTALYRDRMHCVVEPAATSPMREIGPTAFLIYRAIGRGQAGTSQPMANVSMRTIEESKRTAEHFDTNDEIPVNEYDLSVGTGRGTTNWRVEIQNGELVFTDLRNKYNYSQVGATVLSAEDEDRQSALLHPKLKYLRLESEGREQIAIAISDAQTATGVFSVDGRYAKLNPDFLSRAGVSDLTDEEISGRSWVEAVSSSLKKGETVDTHILMPLRGEARLNCERDYQPIDFSK